MWDYNVNSFQMIKKYRQKLVSCKVDFFWKKKPPRAKNIPPFFRKSEQQRENSSGGKVPIY